MSDCQAIILLPVIGDCWQEKKDPHHLKIFNIVMALLLIASILPVVWEMRA
jgi:hypothetical protein